MKSISKKIARLINLVIDTAAVVAFLGTFLLVIINVIGRYVTYLGSLSWSEEGARYLFICTCCFGLIQVTRKRDHFAINMLVDAFPPAAKKLCGLFVNVLIMALTAVLLHGSLLMASFTVNNKSSALGLPTCVLYYLEAFSALGMLLCVAKNTVEDLLKKQSSAETQSAAAAGESNEKE